MSTKKEQHSNSHFLAALTGCMLLLAGTAAAHSEFAPGANIRHADVISHSLDGKLQHTFRKIRHLVSFFLDQDQASRTEQTAVNRPQRLCLSDISGYTSVFSYKVRHVKNQEIKSWLLRV